MPPKYLDGTFKPPRKSGLTEYRFMYNGKQISVYGKSKPECWNKRTIILSGKTAIKSLKQYTVGEWIWEYYNRFRKLKSAAKNQEQLERYIKEICAAPFSKKTLKKATGAELQDFANSRNKAPRARDIIMGIICGAFDKAFKLGYIKSDPCAALDIKKHKSKHYPVIQLADQRQLFEKITEPKYLALFMFCCCTGLRIGEAVNADIDIKNGIVYVTDEDTSTKKHRREIEFLPHRIPYIKLLSEVTVRGAQLYFKKLYKKLGIKAVVHSFRVTFISCCNYIKIDPKWIQDKVGHSTIEMTMETYAKFIKRDGTSIILEYLKELKKTFDL